MAEQQDVQSDTEGSSVQQGQGTKEHDDVDKEQHMHMVDSDKNDSDSDESVMIHFSYVQVGKYKRAAKRYGDMSIFIDTGLTFSVFNNPKMLLNIRASGRTLKAYTNGGCQDSKSIGDLQGSFPVWYNPKSMINKLAWSDVRDKYHIIADT